MTTSEVLQAANTNISSTVPSVEADTPRAGSAVAADDIEASMNYQAAVVLGPKRILLQALVDEAGLPNKAVLVDGNKLVPKLNAQGKTIVILGPEGKTAECVESVDMSRLVTLNCNGEPVLATAGEDGLVRATIGKSNRVEGAVDEDGVPELVQGRQVTFIAPSPPREQQKAAAPSIQNASLEAIDSPNQQQLVEELQRRLKMLEQNVVSGGTQAKNAELKEALKRKKKKAEQRKQERLRASQDFGNEEDAFEAVYGGMQVTWFVPLVTVDSLLFFRMS